MVAAPRAPDRPPRLPPAAAKLAPAGYVPVGPIAPPLPPGRTDPERDAPPNATPGAPYLTGRDLADLEDVIEQGLETFYQVGAALAEVRARKLFVEAGFATFEAYADRRWGLSRSRAYQLVDGAIVVDRLSTSVDSALVDLGLLPTTEAQTRPLARLKDEPALLARAWAAALAEAQPDPATGRAVPTGPDVQRAVDRVRTGGAPGAARPAGPRQRSLLEALYAPYAPPADPDGALARAAAEMAADGPWTIGEAAPAGAPAPRPRPADQRWTATPTHAGDGGYAVVQSGPSPAPRVLVAPPPAVPGQRPRAGRALVGPLARRIAALLNGEEA